MICGQNLEKVRERLSQRIARVRALQKETSFDFARAAAENSQTIGARTWTSASSS
jgi:hypothetical protein